LPSTGGEAAARSASYPALREELRKAIEDMRDQIARIEKRALTVGRD